MHTHRRGKSHSIRPVIMRSPSWISQDSKQIEELVVKYAKDGLTSSQIGMKLRDQHAIPLVKSVTKKTVMQILEENKLKPEIPEDLNNIVKRAVGLQKHLKTNKKDFRNIRSLELIEAKVHRLSVYYKRTGQLAKNWKYKSVVAQLE